MKKQGSILRITIIAGFILVIISCIFLLVIFIIGRSGSRAAGQQYNFFEELRGYDISVQNNEKDYAQLSRELDRLERMTLSVETWLSLLKRRRALSQVYPSLKEEYQKSLERALKAYPQSQYINALAAAALVKDTALNSRTEETLRESLALLTDPAFSKLRLDFHILLGDFRNPEEALIIPPDLLFYNDNNEENIAVNLALLKIIRKLTSAAAADIQALLGSPSPSDNVIRFAAEYYYDFGDLNLSAQLFSLLEGDAALIRQADALYLAGYTENARLLWSMLSNVHGFYNLALTSDNDSERFTFLESLYQTENRRIDSPAVLAGLIHYSRLLEFERAVIILDSVQKNGRFHHPLIDLELIKRQAWQQEGARRVAEAWLLLDRHHENTDLYHWAAWLMTTQRSFNELEILINRIDNYMDTEMFNEWLPFYKAANLMQSGYLDRAENYLRSIPAETAGWYVNANLGRILHARHSYNRAIEQYGLAAGKMPQPKATSRIEQQIARCHSALGRAGEAADAFRYAIELDPENVTARLELDRLIGGN